jgi:hypothetical protein
VRNSVQLARQYTGIGVLQEKMGDTIGALQHGTKAVKIFTRLGMSDTEEHIDLPQNRVAKLAALLLYRLQGCTLHGS